MPAGNGDRDTAGRGGTSRGQQSYQRAFKQRKEVFDAQERLRAAKEGNAKERAKIKVLKRKNKEADKIIEKEKNKKAGLIEA